MSGERIDLLEKINVLEMDKAKLQKEVDSYRLKENKAEMECSTYFDEIEDFYKNEYYCPCCKNIVDNKDKFCKSCGQKLILAGKEK